MSKLDFEPGRTAYDLEQFGITYQPQTPEVIIPDKSPILEKHPKLAKLEEDIANGLASGSEAKFPLNQTGIVLASTFRPYSLFFVENMENKQRAWAAIHPLSSSQRGYLRLAVLGNDDLSWVPANVATLGRESSRHDVEALLGFSVLLDLGQHDSAFKATPEGLGSHITTAQGIANEGSRFSSKFENTSEDKQPHVGDSLQQVGSPGLPSEVSADDLETSGTALIGSPVKIIELDLSNTRPHWNILLREEFVTDKAALTSDNHQIVLYQVNDPRHISVVQDVARVTLARRGGQAAISKYQGVI
jgi:hypothetical protein